MGDTDIYDIMPHKEIANLKRELKDLKDQKNSPEVSTSMEALTRSMDSMLHLFTEAAEELKLEGKEESELAGKLDPINKKLDRISEQNQTIAEGLVAVSDMIKDFVSKHHEEETKIEIEQKPASDPFAVHQPQPQQSFGQAPPMPTAPSFNQSPQPTGDPFGAPPSPAGGPPPSSPNVPFPDIPEEPPKKGIFGRLKK